MDERVDGLYEKERCPICGEEYDEFVESNGRKVVRCRGCRVLFVTPRPSTEEIRRLFQDEYIGDEERVMVDFTSMRIDSLKREADRIRELRPMGGRLLDVGTASGAFLTCMSGDLRWQVEGLEPSLYGARAATKITGVPVHVGFLRDQGFPSASFDVLTSLDAFYFHHEPNEDIAEMARILKLGGLLVIEIPGLNFRLLKNTGFLCRLIYGVSARLNAGVHLFYYSRETLGKLVVKHGFEEFAVYAEQSPLYGAWYLRWVAHAYFWFSRGLYSVTAGKINVAPKEFIVYRKVMG